MLIKNKKLLFISILLGLFSTYSFQFFLLPETNIIWLLIFISITVLFYKTLSAKHSVPVKIVSIIIGILYSLMVFLGYELRKSGGIDLYPMVLISFLGLSLFFAIALIRVFSYLLSTQIILDTTKKHSAKANHFCCFCFADLLAACFVVLFSRKSHIRFIW